MRKSHPPKLQPRRRRGLLDGAPGGVVVRVSIQGKLFRRLLVARRADQSFFLLGQFCLFDGEASSAVLLFFFRNVFSPRGAGPLKLWSSSC